jgi:hypothetical protein
MLTGGSISFAETKAERIATQSTAFHRRALQLESGQRQSRPLSGRANGVRSYASSRQCREDDSAGRRAVRSADRPLPMPFPGSAWAQNFRSSLKRNCNPMQYCLLKSVCEMSQPVPTDRARQPPATNIDATTRDTGGITIAGFRADTSVQTALAEVENRKAAPGGAVVCCIMNRLNSGARSDLQSHLGACLIYRLSDC